MTYFQKFIAVLAVGFMILSGFAGFVMISRRQSGYQGVNQTYDGASYLALIVFLASLALLLFACVGRLSSKKDDAIGAMWIREDEFMRGVLQKAIKAHQQANASQASPSQPVPTTVGIVLEVHDNIKHDRKGR